MRKPHFQGQLLFQHIQNRRRGLILRLRLCHPFMYGRSATVTVTRRRVLGMAFGFIENQNFDGLFEFLVHLPRGLRFHLSGGAQCIVNGL